LKYGAAAWDLGHGSGVCFQAWMNLRNGELERAVDFAEQWDELMVERFDNLLNLPTLRLFIEAEIDAAKVPLILEMLAEHESHDLFLILFTGYVAFDHIDEAYRVVNELNDLECFHKLFVW